MRTLLLIAVFVACSISSFPVLAASSIGVVDVFYVLDNAVAAKNIEQQRTDLRGTFLKDISDAEQKLRKEEKTLGEQRKTLKPEDFAIKRRAYETALLETRKKAQDKKRILEESYNAAMNQLRDQLTVIVQQIANEKGYELVISNKNVITGEKSLDITQETLKRLNESISQIPLKLHEQKK